MLDKEELLKEAKSNYEKQMEEGEFKCETDDCSSQSFDVNLYVASESRYEGTAICRECNERHEISMPVEGLDDELEELKEQIEDAFDEI